jgi:hypothetical protein
MAIGAIVLENRQADPFARAMTAVAMGLIAGLAGSFALRRFIEGLLFETRAEESV